MQVFSKKMQKNLCMSKKSCNFASDFALNGNLSLRNNEDFA